MKAENYPLIPHREIATKIKINIRNDLYIMEAKWTLGNNQYYYTATCINRLNMVTYIYDESSIKEILKYLRFMVVISIQFDFQNLNERRKMIMGKEKEKTEDVPV